jgi:hypothetical protein
MTDITNQTFGRLTAIRPNHKVNGAVHWECKCECGRTKIASIYNLLSSKTQSCGCLQKERASQARATHRMSNHPAYQAWHRIRNRCENPEANDYPNYGGRGIHIADEWQNFDAFWSEMGPSWKAGLSIERMDNDGDYAPGNCAWVTQVRQVRNRRNTVFVDSPWGHIAAADAAEKCGVPYRTFIQRVYAGWSGEALFQPLMRARMPSPPE